MKNITLILFFMSLTWTAYAMEGVVDGKCYVGGMLGYVITTKIDSRHFEMFSDIDGNHAILETNNVGTYGPGRLPNVLVKHLGSKVMTLKNGFDGKVELWKECTGKEKGAAETIEKFNRPLEITAKDLAPSSSAPASSAIKQDRGVDNAYNKCTESCRTKFADQKKEAIACYAECDKK